MRRLLRALRPPRRLRVTGPGKCFLALTVGVGVAATNTGNNLLYLALSMNLSLIVFSGILSEWCLRGLRIRVAHASDAFAARESMLAVTCSVERKRFPAFSIAVSPRFAGTGRAAWFSAIPAGGAETRLIPWHPARRGPVGRCPCNVSTRFPFALFEKSAEVRPSGPPLIVYPEPAFPAAAAAGAIPGERGAGRRSGRQGASVRGAREHMPADPVRDIHWKASARLGKWMVKEREPDPARTLDVQVAVPSPPAELEPAVSRACAAVLRCEREGVPYRLRVGGRALVDAGSGGRRRKALSILARLQSDGTLAAADGELRP